MYVVIYGSLISGLKAVGPFTQLGQAVVASNQYIDDNAVADVLELDGTGVPPTVTYCPISHWGKRCG